MPAPLPMPDVNQSKITHHFTATCHEKTRQSTSTTATTGETSKASSSSKRKLFVEEDKVEQVASDGSNKKSRKE